MLTKELNKNFRSIPKEELVKLNGGMTEVRIGKSIRELVEFIDVLRRIDKDGYYTELRFSLEGLKNELMRKKRR